ncbi:hypothetical protein D3C87_466260 [compost metagenome]
MKKHQFTAIIAMGIDNAVTVVSIESECEKTIAMVNYEIQSFGARSFLDCFNESVPGNQVFGIIAEFIEPEDGGFIEYTLKECRNLPIGVIKENLGI